MKAQDSRKSARFRMDEQGTIAVMFGLLAIPVVLFVGLAVDYTRAVAVDRDLQEAVDAASMAAATYKLSRGPHASSTSTTSGGTISQGDVRSARQVALDYLQNNFKSGTVHNLTRDAVEAETLLTVTASAEVPTTFGRLVLDKFRIDARASVRMKGSSAPLCLLGLNANAPDTVKAWGTADLVAPACAVQSNSSSSTGLNVGGSATMTASVFCSAGGHGGSSYSPDPKDNCPRLSDPFAGKYTPEALLANGINLKKACSTTSEVKVRSDTIFYNGTVFCKGIEVQSGATLTLGPGFFVIYDELQINGGGTVKATEGTTIVFADRRWTGQEHDGELDLKGGGNLFVTAPKSGPLDSIAILQPSVSGYTGGTSEALTHTVTGGGTVQLIGNWYTPQAKTYFTGNGVVNATSPYFSITSDLVELEGTGTLKINAGGDASSIGMEGPPGAGLGVGGTISLAE